MSEENLLDDLQLHNFDALVIVDMQEWIASLALSPISAKELSSNVETLLETWRASYPDKPIVWVAYARQGRGDENLEGDARIILESAFRDPMANEHCVIKYGISAFQRTWLHSLLQNMGIKSCVITGIATDYAVSATAYEAHEHGYTVWVPQDMCSASSSRAHTSTLRYLSTQGIFTREVLGRCLPLL